MSSLSTSPSSALSLEERKSEGYKGRLLSPLLHYLNGRPVSLHVRGGERSGDNTRVRRRTAKRMAFVGR